MKTLTILLIEDNPPDVRLINEMLKDVKLFKFSFFTSATLKDGCEQIQKNNFDVILLDLNLPDSTGQQTFQNVKQCCNNVPIILITGLDDERLSLELIKEGAQNYITKQRLNSVLLGKTIQYSIERKQAEIALKKSEEKFRNLVETTSDIIWETNIDGLYTYINPNVEKILGYKYKELIGRSPFDFMPPDEAKKIKIISDEIVASKKTYDNLVNINLHKDGHPVLLETSGVPVFDSENNFRGYRGIDRDITERKKAKDAITRQNDLLLKLNRFSIELSLLQNENDLEELIVKGLKDLSGAEVVMFNEYSYEEKVTRVKHFEMNPGLIEKVTHLLGKKIKSVESPVSDEIYHEMTTEVIGRRSTLYEASFGSVSRPVGAAIQALLKVDRFIGIAFLANGKLYGTSLLAMKKGQPDIPDEILENFAYLSGLAIERRNAEHALRESEERYRALFEGASDGIALADAGTGILIDCNQALCSLVERSKTELIGKSQTILHPPEDSHDGQSASFIQHKKQKPGKSLEDTLLSKSGKMIPIEIKAGRICNNKRNLMIGIFRDITERKQAVDALQESDKILKEAQRIGKIGNWEFDVITKKIKWSDQTFALYERDIEMVPPTAEEEAKYYTETQSNTLKDFAQQSVEKGLDFNYNIEPILPSGRKVFYSCSMRPVKDKNGKVVKLFGVVQDITKRKKAEELIFQAKKDWEESFDSITDMITIHDNDFNIIQANNAAKSHLNLPVFEKQIKYKCFAFYHGTNAPPKGCQSCDCIRSGMPGTFELFEPHLNRDLEIRAIPRFDSNNTCVGMIHIARDISERKKSEMALKESEKKYRLLADNSADVIFIFDMNLNYTYISPSVKKLRGYEPEELIGRSIAGTLTPEAVSKVRTIIEEEFELEKTGNSDPGRSRTIEVEMLRKDGSRVWTESKATLMKDKNNDPLGIIGVTRDISGRKKAEEDLMKAKEKAEESDRLKSAFLANMSHEIRTPMNGILGFAGLLAEPHLTDEKQQEYIRIIEQSGKRMLNIINDIVDISKIESGQMKISISPANINEQIQYLHVFFKPEAEKKGLHISFMNSLPEKDAIIKTDKEKVYAILTNLIKNAIKFTQKGSIEFGYVKKGKYLEFFVKDTGMGILPEQKKVIFERFRQGSESYSRNYEGAGLGLSISKAYVEMLGGNLWLDNGPEGKPEENGSTFYFTLPYNTEAEEKTVVQKDASLTRQESQTKNLKILIAEDDETSEKLISIVVEKLSDNVLFARTGTEAVKMCRNNPELDIILMDVKMPEMNGYEATMQIRQFNKDVVIIAQTAFALSDEKEKALKAGCNDYISKPIVKEELHSLIQKHFGI